MRVKAGPMVLVAVVAIVVGGFVVGRTVLDDGSPCGALSARVADLGGYSWENGITSSGSEWISVFATGATEADGPSREDIAAAVAADPEGFDRFRAALPDDLGPAADRLHAVALDPGSDRTASEVERDLAALNRHGMTACNLAP